jgi:hypothetical protein
MKISRREFAALLAAPRLLGQMATRNITAQKRSRPSRIPFVAHFVDVAAQAGLLFPTVYGPADHKDYLLEENGCGCAFLDYDNDGWMDLLVLSGTRLHGPPEGTSSRLYKNNRDGTFLDVTKDAGLFGAEWASAITVGDYDNDGFDDLFITAYGRNTLYHNNGDGTFTDVTRKAGLLDSEVRWGSGCCFVDYDRDGHLDLFVSNYCRFDLATVPKAGTPGGEATCNWKGISIPCGPRGLPLSRHSLYHNNGDGTFREVSSEAGIAKVRPGYGLTVVAADFDNDGWPDIYVACDSTASLLFRNRHNGTFEEIGLRSGVAINEDGQEQAGMGIGVGDINLDGNLDIFKTHFADDTNILYINDGAGMFEDRTLESGLAVETRFVSWGAGIVDLDNDGLPDIFYVTGNIFPNLDSRLPNYPYKTPRVIFRNLGNGRLEELIEDAGPAISAVHSSRGCAFGDFDNDGDIDILVVNLNEPPSLLRNDISGNNHWIKVKLIGTVSNRSAIGARVVCSYGSRQQVQEVMAQSSFFSCNDPRLHFGLGSATSASLKIPWPRGATQVLRDVRCNQILTIREPIGPPKSV